MHRSGLADLALGAPSAGGDCFAGNQHATSQPPGDRTAYPCAGSGRSRAAAARWRRRSSALTRYLDAQDGTFPHGDWRTQPAPPPTAIDARRTLRTPRRTLRSRARPCPQQYRIRPIERDPLVAGSRPCRRRCRVWGCRSQRRGGACCSGSTATCCRCPVRRLGGDRDVGSDPPGVVADLAPGALDAGRPRGAVRRSAPLLRLRSVADPAAAAAGATVAGSGSTRCSCCSAILRGAAGRPRDLAARAGSACACSPCPSTRSSRRGRGRPRRSNARGCRRRPACRCPTMSMTRIGSTDSGIRLTFVRIRSGSASASARGRKSTSTGRSSARRALSCSSTSRAELLAHASRARSPSARCRRLHVAAGDLGAVLVEDHAGQRVQRGVGPHSMWRRSQSISP